MERRLGWLPATLNYGCGTEAIAWRRCSVMICRRRFREYRPLVSALDRLPLEQRDRWPRPAESDAVFQCQDGAAELHLELSGRSDGDGALDRGAGAVPGPPRRRSRGARAGEHEGQGNSGKACAARSGEGCVDTGGVRPAEASVHDAADAERERPDARVLPGHVRVAGREGPADLRHDEGRDDARSGCSKSRPINASRWRAVCSASRASLRCKSCSLWREPSSAERPAIRSASTGHGWVCRSACRRCC